MPKQQEGLGGFRPKMGIFPPCDPVSVFKDEAFFQKISEPNKQGYWWAKIGSSPILKLRGKKEKAYNYITTKNGE